MLNTMVEYCRRYRRMWLYMNVCWMHISGICWAWFWFDEWNTIINYNKRGKKIERFKDSELINNRSIDCVCSSILFQLLFLRYILLLNFLVKCILQILVVEEKCYIFYQWPQFSQKCGEKSDSIADFEEKIMIFSLMFSFLNFPHN